MIFQLSLSIGITIIILAFFAEYMDSTLGMGYGTSLTPILFLMGFEPLQVVPAILLSELITGILGGFTHHVVGNVDFRPKTMNVKKIIYSLKKIGVTESIRKGLSTASKVVIILSICSIVGSTVAVVFAVSIPKFYLKLFIGFMIFIIGMLIILTIKRQYSFSWKKVIILGLIASFNKGMSGGGYGPVVTGGQLISGIDEKNSIGITSLSEGLTCMVGVIAFTIANDNVQ